MGLLATEFDEEEFKKGYSKVCYEDGVEDGRKEGIKIGEEKGQKIGIKLGADNAKRELTINFYKSGVPIETISVCTGLSIDKIKQIIKE